MVDRLPDATPGGATAAGGKQGRPHQTKTAQETCTAAHVSRAYIALGSNLDNPANQLQQAVAAIDAMAHTSITAVSEVYRSAAVGPGEQADYLNAVLEIETTLSPEALLLNLQAQENRQGRTRTVRWGARTLDLDILLYGDRQMDTEALKIPHPAMKDRHFVLYPLAELTGSQAVLPCGTDIATVVSRCPRGDLTLTEVSLTYPRKAKGRNVR